MTKVTAKQVAAAPIKDKQYKFGVGDGIYLLIKPNGSKLWRLKYRIDKKEKTLSMGSYPEVTLAQARANAHQAKAQIANNVDPSSLRREASDLDKTSEHNNYQRIAEEWFRVKSPGWGRGHLKRQRRLLDKDILPAFGDKAVISITPKDALALIRKVESRDAPVTGQRVRIVMSQIFRFGMAIGECDRDITAGLTDAMVKHKPEHFAAIISPEKLGDTLRAFDTYHGGMTTKNALKLMPLLFVRTNELRHMEWSEINFDDAVWSIPGSKIKMDNDHIVPLSTQAIETLNEQKQLSGRFQYVFPCDRTTARPMSEGAMLGAIRRMGFTKDELSIHGFRATARTLLDEKLKYRFDLVEHQLAHAVRDTNGRAYNRTQHLEARAEMMQAWSDYLDKLKGVGYLPVAEVSGQSRLDSF